MRARPYRISKLWGTRELSNRFNIKKNSKKTQTLKLSLPLDSSKCKNPVSNIYLLTYILFSWYRTFSSFNRTLPSRFARVAKSAMLPGLQLSILSAAFFISRLLPVFPNRINGHFLLYLRPLFTIQCTSCMLGLIEHSCYL